MQVIKVYENIGGQCLLMSITPSVRGHQEAKTFFLNKVYFITLILYSERI